MNDVCDAALKWCPLVRDITGDRVGNVESSAMDGRNPEWARCIGWRCMMWRYYENAIEDGHLDCDGYCGLAGKPIGAN